MHFNHIMLSAALLLNPFGLFAQIVVLSGDTTRLPQVQLEETEITSMREQGLLSQLPITAGVIDDAMLARRQVFSMKDLGTLVPNVFIPDYGSRLTSPVYIRGVGSRINAPSVGLYVDNIPYFEKSVFDFDLIDIQRMEVLRGPQGTLYGRNTMGGLINVYSKSPFRQTGTRVAMAGGNPGFFNATVSHSRLLTSTTGLSISGGINRHDGYFENAFTGGMADAHFSAGGRLRFTKQLPAGLQLEFTSHVELLDQGGYPYAIYEPGSGLTHEVNYDRPSSYARTMISNGFVTRYQARGVMFQSVTAYQYFFDKQKIDQDFTPMDLVFAIQDQVQHMASQELTIRKHRPGTYQWIFGMFGFMQSLDHDLDIQFGEDAVAMQFVPVPLSRIQASAHQTKGAAIFHQSAWHDLFVQGLSLTAGLRLDYESASLDHLAYLEADMPTPPPQEFDSHLAFYQVLPRLALNFAPGGTTALFASLTRGFKTGGFNMVFEREEDRSFGPEYSWNYELGLKGFFPGRGFSYQAAVFYIDWKDQQIYQMLPSGQGSMLSNAGKSVSKGFELDLDYIPGNGWRYRGSYGYTHATFSENRPDPDTDLSGYFIPYVPRHTLSAMLEYQIVLKGDMLRAMTIGLNYQGLGRHYWNQHNTTHQSWYALAGAQLTFDFAGFQADLWVRNIFNETYHAFSFAALGNHYVQQGRPSTFGLTLRYGL